MNIVLGLTDVDIDALYDIQEVINLRFAKDSFPDGMTEKECDVWVNIGAVINKICYVIENQTEIDKTATGMTPTAVCQNGSLLSDEEIRCVRKMIKELNLDHL